MKKAGIIVLTLLILSWIIPLISAYGYLDFRQGSNQVIQWIQDFSGPFFEVMLNTSTYDQYFFAKSLFLILTFVVVLTVLEKVSMFEDKTGVRVILAVAIAIMGARYVTELQFVQYVLLPYSVLAIAITMGLNLLIFGYFIHSAVPGAAGRKFGWIIFLAILIGMFFDRLPELSEGGVLAYSIGILLAIAAIAFDRRLQEYVGLRAGRDAERNILTQRLAFIEQKLQVLNAATPSANITRTITALEKEYRTTVKKLAKL